MNDIPLDEILEEGVRSDELENRFGFRTIPRGPILFEAHLGWLRSKDNADHGEDFPMIDLTIVQENIAKALKQHDPDIVYGAVQLFVTRSRLTAEDPIFTDLQLYLKEYKINTVLLPYVAPEGHA